MHPCLCRRLYGVIASETAIYKYVVVTKVWNASERYLSFARSLLSLVPENGDILCCIHFVFICRPLYRGADKSLARSGRKQANVSVRMARISVCALPCRNKNMIAARVVSILLKSRASLTCLRACFHPDRTKDLSAPRAAVPNLYDSRCPF